MKANKKTLLAVKNYLQQQDGWDLDAIINDIVVDTKLLRTKEMGESTLSMDECGIQWGGEDVCLLETFVETYTDLFIENICNVLDSFVGEHIDYYLEDEE
ncbi:MAG: hypothetical protein RR891_07530 [Clostridium sp.]|uniref:hypothetical protein n=1 Tax=Clostridium sp. TaxID=1506 RepID=UPI003052EDE0